RDPADIERTILAMGNPLDDPDGFIASMADYAELGVELVELMPVGDPVAFTSEVAERIIPALAELGP
ncbi:MAG: LLM class F420-dependent oxidoreductase, partial [Acidimicrobiales bacterium]